MKLSSSTGDFGNYVESIPEMIRAFGGTKFRHINLEQSGSTPELISECNDDWKRFANACGEAAADANVTFVLAHAPCFHNAILPALDDPTNEEYRRNVRGIRRSIEVCHALGIPRIVIHACASGELNKETFYRYNQMFYREFFDLAEKYNVMILTENWDNDASLFATGAEMREFIEFVDHPLLGACWDTAHGNLAKGAKALGQYQNITALGGRLHGLHISDNFGDVHHHSWPFAGIINFDAVMQGLLDVNYDGYFNFEASYSLLHHRNLPYHRKPFVHNGETVTRLLDPSLALKQKATDLLYDVGQYSLETYGCYEA